MEKKKSKWIIYPSLSPSSHLSLSQIIVDHCKVESQLLHVALIGLKEEEVAVHLWVQGLQMVDVHIGTGAQQFRQEETGKR